jgi:serine O-acetyltransferase
MSDASGAGAPSLLELLKADAARQLHFAGVPDARVSGLRLARMLPSPRFVPVVLYRLSYWCARRRLGPIAKLFSLANFVLFGLEIGVTCEIGPGLYFPHTLGTVLGPRRIGKNAVIYHGVTVGAKEPDLGFDPAKRPLVGDGVFIGSGAKVLGGVTLGDGCVVAANAVVVRSVAPGDVVAGVPARVVKRTATPADDGRAAAPPDAGEPA